MALGYQSGPSTGDSIPERQTQVAGQAQRLNGLVVELQNEIEAFEKRLVCVTNPHPAAPMLPEKEKDMLVPLAENLRATGNQLGAAISSLRLLAQSIELPYS